MKNFRKFVEAPSISLKEIGWSSSRDDDQIKKYVKLFVKHYYGKEVDDELALIIVFIIDDLLTDIRNDVELVKFRKA